MTYGTIPTIATYVSSIGNPCTFFLTNRACNTLIQVGTTLIFLNTTFRAFMRQICAVFCGNLRNIKICGYAICSLAHLRNLRICDGGMNPRIFGFARFACLRLVLKVHKIEIFLASILKFVLFLY